MPYQKAAEDACTLNNKLIFQYPTFCINLPDFQDRWKSSSKKIQNAGFHNLQRWPATDGRQLRKHILKSILTPRAYDDMNRPRKAHEDLGSKGVVGCYLSHYNIWRFIVEQEIPICIIFEDDVKFEKNFQTKFLQLLDQIQDWNSVDALFFGFTVKIDLFKDFDKHSNFTGKIYEQNALEICKGRFWGMHGYLLTANGARKLLTKALPIDCQVDAYVGYMCAQNQNMRVFFSKGSLVQQDAAKFKSSIQTTNMRLYAPSQNFVYILILGILVASLVSLFFVGSVVNSKKFRTCPNAVRK